MNHRVTMFYSITMLYRVIILWCGFCVQELPGADGRICVEEPEEPDMVCEGEPDVVSDGISVVSPGTPMDLDGADPKTPMSATQTPASEVSPPETPVSPKPARKARTRSEKPANKKANTKASGRKGIKVKAKAKAKSAKCKAKACTKKNTRFPKDCWSKILSASPRSELQDDAVSY